MVEDLLQCLLCCAEWEILLGHRLTAFVLFRVGFKALSMSWIWSSVKWWIHRSGLLWASTANHSVAIVVSLSVALL